MFDLNKNEEKILEYWKEHRILEKMRQKNIGNRRYYFLDGPPYVTGDLHPGHIWVKTLKDIFVRYKRYRGFDVVDRAGYDVHGLPIENKVEKELGITSKKEIESRIGVEEFVKECRKYVEKYLGRMDADYERYGISLNFKNPYLPYTNGYMETVWGMFKLAADRGFLYEGKKTLIYCPHCETSLSQGSMEVEYKDVDDPSIFVAFKIDGQRSKTRINLGGNAYLVIWTTTPWTLPANIAVAANPKALYVMVLAGDRQLILARDRLDAFSSIVAGSFTVLSEFYGSELEGIHYSGPLESKVEKQKELRKFHRVIFSEELVAMGEGTGLVHIAPGHGIDDYVLGVKSKLPVFSPLNRDATYSEEAGEYSGLKVPHDANKVIMHDLESLGLLLGKSTVRHSYPHCWRCSSKLIFMATSQWFFNIQRIKKKLLRENEKTNWHPTEVKGWENAILSNSPDWCISRQRYWGIPMPIWKCGNCGRMTIIGSLDALKEQAVDMKEIESLLDLHRPYIDRIMLRCECGKEKERVKDVLDVWFDSGSAFRASLTAEQFGEFSSAELIVEYVEQIRAWFQYLLKVGVMVYGKRPFNHIAVHGILFGLDGRKMSKSFGNYKPLGEMTRMVTADAFRLWCINYNPILNRNLNESEIKDTEKFVTILHNISKLISEYQDAMGYAPKLKNRISVKGIDEVDAWIVSRVESLAAGVTDSLDRYEAYKAAGALKDFVIDDFSRFYLKLAKKRILYSDKRKAKRILDISNYVLHKTLILASVITPFIAESVYTERYATNESIFLEKWPKADRKSINSHLEERMKIADETITALLNGREKAGISLRWPIAKATVEVRDGDVYRTLQELTNIVADTVNAKKLEIRMAAGMKEEVRPVFSKLGPEFREKAGAVGSALKAADPSELRKAMANGGIYTLHTDLGTVEVKSEHFILVETAAEGDAVGFKYGNAYVDKAISRELHEEAMVREFERRVQLGRKDMGLKKGDRIRLVYRASDNLAALIDKNLKKVKSDLNAVDLSRSEDVKASFVKTFGLDDGNIEIGIDTL